MAGDSATITTGGANGVTLDIDPTLDSFTMNSAAKSLSITGRTITVNGPSTIDAGLVLLNSSTWTGTGKVGLNDKAVLVATGSSSIPNMQDVAGRLTVTGTKMDGASLTNANTNLVIVGTLTLNTDAAGKQTVLTPGRFFLNAGNTTFQGTNGSLALNATISNQGSMAVNANTAIQGQKDGVHINQKSGRITIAKDTILTFTGQSLQNLGTIQGNGVLDVRQLTSVNPKGVVNSGFLKPGSSPGTLTINGDYTQVAAGGTLAIEIDGAAFDPLGSTDYSRLVVNGSALLDGLLDVTIGGGFTPQPSDVFTILTSTSGLDGFFENALPPSGSNIGFLSTDRGSFEVVYNESATGAGSVVLRQFSAVPGPTTLLLLASGFAALVLMREFRSKVSSDP